jgi:hypothetical protein
VRHKSFSWKGWLAFFRLIFAEKVTRFFQTNVWSNCELKRKENW